MADNDLQQALKLVAEFDWTSDLRGARDNAVSLILKTAEDIAVVVKTKSGALMRVHPTTDKTISQEILVSGVYEPALTIFLQRELKPGDCFIDVGANIGCHSVTAAKAVGTQGAVYAFEPHPEMRRRWRDNMRLNDIAQAHLWPVGLGSRRSSFALYEPEGNPGGSVLKRGSAEPSERTVQVFPLDWLLPECAPRIIKIDVEGFEYEVLKGASSLWSGSAPPITVFEYNFTSPRKNLYEFFAVKGWRLFVISEVEGVLTLNRLSDSYIAENFIDIYAIPPNHGQIVEKYLAFDYPHEEMRKKYGDAAGPSKVANA
jgi:FkbM family methyltransferase